MKTVAYYRVGNAEQLGVKGICTKYNLKQTELADRFGIPLRTVQDWHGERRKAPDYVIRMMIELLEIDRSKA